ncbi:MAG: APC family permease [Candidatus Thorarchaeota archaeon]|nr:APC family permease [Candidatus Thorarchaeota archaeon]
MENKDRISLIGIIGIGLTAVIGSGIWKDSLLWSNSAGIFSLLTLSIGWILMFTVGLAYAECVGMFPQGGGPYSYVGGAFGRKAGSFVGMLYVGGYYCIGALLSFLASLFSLAALSYGTFELLTTPNIFILTMVYIVLFTLFSSFTPGRKFGTISFVWVVIKILLVVGVFAFVLLKWSTATFDVPTFDGFQTAINTTIFALLGFEIMLVFAGETENAEKTVPKGILIALPIFLILYLFVSLAASGIVGIGDIAAGDQGSISLIILLASSAGVYGGWVFGFAAFSAAGVAYAILAMTTKQTKILAGDGVLPEVFARDQNFGPASVLTLVMALIVGGLMTGTMDIWAESVDVFATAGLGLILISAMLPAGLSALALRQKMPALVRPFKTPAYIIIFPLSILLSIYLIYLNFSVISLLLPSLFVVGAIALVAAILVFTRGNE